MKCETFLKTHKISSEIPLMIETSQKTQTMMEIL